MRPNGEILDFCGTPLQGTRIEVVAYLYDLPYTDAVPVKLPADDPRLECTRQGRPGLGDPSKAPKKPTKKQVQQALKSLGLDTRKTAKPPAVITGGKTLTLF